MTEQQKDQLTVLACTVGLVVITLTYLAFTYLASIAP